MKVAGGAFRWAGNPGGAAAQMEAEVYSNVTFDAEREGALSGRE